jgi:hypothetical protein
VYLYTAAALHEAQMLVDLLAEAGIEARLSNEHLVGAFGALPYGASLPEIWLSHAEDWNAACGVLAEYERNRERAHQGGEIVCAQCGESSPANFELCWRCRADLASTPPG